MGKKITTVSHGDVITLGFDDGTEVEFQGNVRAELSGNPRGSRPILLRAFVEIHEKNPKLE